MLVVAKETFDKESFSILSSSFSFKDDFILILLKDSD